MNDMAQALSCISVEMERDTAVINVEGPADIANPVREVLAKLQLSGRLAVALAPFIHGVANQAAQMGIKATVDRMVTEELWQEEGKRTLPIVRGAYTFCDPNATYQPRCGKTAMVMGEVAHCEKAPGHEGEHELNEDDGVRITWK